MEIWNPGNSVQLVQISHDLGEGWMNSAEFAQFTVNFESSIYHCVTWKMVCEFHIICWNVGLLGYLGGVHQFLIVGLKRRVQILRHS